MKRAIVVLLAVLSVAQVATGQTTVAVDKDKTRNNDRGAVQWKTQRTGAIDVPYVILQNSNGTPATTPGVQRTWTLQAGVTTASATITAGALSVSIVPSADFAGTINGATISGSSSGSVFTARVIAPDTLPAIAYTRSAGSLTISVIR